MPSKKESRNSPLKPFQKSSMIEEILCVVRRQIRSIVSLCEEFDVRRTRAKRANQNDFYCALKTANTSPFCININISKSIS